MQALAALRDASGNLETTGGVIAGTPTNPAPHTIGATMAGLGDALDTTRQAAQASTGPNPTDPGGGCPGRRGRTRQPQTTLALQSGFLTGGTSAAKDIVDQVGAAAVQVTLLAMSFNEFSTGNIGRAALSGNVLGVVMTLLPSVLDGGRRVRTVRRRPDHDAAGQHLPADGRLPERGERPVRPGVRESLTVSAQLVDIAQKLDRAVIDIEQARVQIGQMYDSLTRLQGSLDAVQNNILEALRNGTNSQLRQTISSALGYADRNDSPLPLSEFNNAAALPAHLRHGDGPPQPGAQHRLPVLRHPQRCEPAEHRDRQQRRLPRPAAGQAGTKHGRLSGTTGDAPQLANMDDFVLASRAYAQLMLENPRYVSAGYRRWLSDIQHLGTPLAALTSAIATSDTADGTHSTLLNRLVCARDHGGVHPDDLTCLPGTDRGHHTGRHAGQPGHGSADRPPSPASTAAGSRRRARR